jgi:predicted nucleotidyltransferase
MIGIDAVLRRVAEEEVITVLFAVEAGSRAWGFPSPDSDFDVRFVFVRRLDRYLTIRRVRDVIEHNEGVIDLAGWDIRKALLLMLNGNHAVREWLRSPIRYISTEFDRIFLDLAQRTPSHSRLAFSYRSLLHKVLRDYLPMERERVLLKKYFYAIRSALVIEWLQMHKDTERVPPMCLSELLAQSRIDPRMRDEIDCLLAKKRVTSELGYGPRLPATDQFIFRCDTNDPLPPTSPHSDKLIEQYDSVLRRAILG